MCFQQDASSGQPQLTSGAEVTTRKIEVPNNKVFLFFWMRIISVRFCPYCLTFIFVEHNASGKFLICHDFVSSSCHYQLFLLEVKATVFALV